jgi:TonB family protein
MLEEIPDVSPKKILVMPLQPFRPLPPEPTPTPREHARRVPIPDPTPDLPEPLLTAEPIDLAIDLPSDGLFFDFPESPPALPEQGPLRVDGDVRAPVKIHAPLPVYTEIARRARIQGVVFIEAIIDKQGQVSSTRILRSLPMGLDRAAEEAVRRWRFEPATLNGKPVAVLFNLSVSFELH